jgi:hypothetical protein
VCLTRKSCSAFAKDKTKNATILFGRVGGLLFNSKEERHFFIKEFMDRRSVVHVGGGVLVHWTEFNIDIEKDLNIFITKSHFLTLQGSHTFLFNISLIDSASCFIRNCTEDLCFSFAAECNCSPCACWVFHPILWAEA